MEQTEEQVTHLLQQQRSFFATHQTRGLAFRLAALKRLKAAILRHESAIGAALQADLHKSFEEAYLTEIAIVLQELDNHIRHVRRWSKPENVRTPLHLLFSRSRIVHEPLGVCLIIAPFNYPFQLLLNPLVGALSAGCCAIVKPSPDVPHVARIVQQIIAEVFDEQHVACVTGGKETNTLLLAQRFDLIFFTGSTAVGKVVMKAAAAHLTPVVLELGGKSPCIVDSAAAIGIAAKRIAWGKTINAGQTCIAPDYLFVHDSVKDRLLAAMAAAFREMYGDDARKSPHYARIVTEKAVARIEDLLKDTTIYCGGETDPDGKYVAPTIVTDIAPEHPLMQEEIFGPVLPVMTFREIDEVIAFVNAREKPLALYYFGDGDNARRVLAHTSSGGACVNDVLLHIANHRLPFGGVGSSGTGKYHGRDSFLAFSNRKSVVKSPTWFDIKLKYPVYRHFGIARKLL